MQRTLHGVLEDPHPEREPLRLATIATGLLVLPAPAGVQATWLIAVAAALVVLAVWSTPAATPPPTHDKV